MSEGFFSASNNVLLKNRRYNALFFVGLESAIRSVSQLLHFLFWCFVSRCSSSNFGSLISYPRHLFTSVPCLFILSDIFLHLSYLWNLCYHFLRKTAMTPNLFTQMLFDPTQKKVACNKSLPFGEVCLHLSVFSVFSTSRRIVGISVSGERGT